jgi:outer membrane protein OmpA-like peptidoglycan-associated protein
VPAPFIKPISTGNLLVFNTILIVFQRPFAPVARHNHIHQHMANIRFPRLRFLFFFLFLQTLMHAQKAGLEVTRCAAIDRNLPVLTVTIDGGGRKWASNKKGVFEVRAHDLANLRAIPDGEKSALAVKCGNADVTWDDEELQSIFNKACSVTAVWYDSKAQELWIGTDEAGLFQLKTNPALKLVQQYTPANTKLKTNHITSIFQDKTGRFWIGSQQGLMFGAPGRWKSDLSGYPVQRVREYGTEVFVLADGELSKTTDGSKWTDLNVDPKNLEGQINDFDVDASGYLWMVSGVLTRLEFESGKFDIFSGPEYYTSEFGTCLAVAPDGSVWVGTDDKGLFHVDKASNIVVNCNLDEGISCDGNGKDAVVSVKVTGGLNPFTYAWSGGLSGANPRNVAPGTYSVTATDATGKSRTASIQVPDTRLKPTVKQKRNASSSTATDGVAVVDLEGNASGVKALWDNGETLVEATRLSAGTHSVTITNQKGCVSTATVVITEKAAPLGLALLEKVPVKCAGDLATLAAKVTGGRAPYKYKWSIAGQSAEQVGNVAPGNYTVTVTDNDGKTMSATYDVAKPKELSIDVQVQAQATADAADGKAFAMVKGGTGVITYQWDNGEKLPAATKLNSGKHSVSVTDENGCVALAFVEVSEALGPLSVKINEKTKIDCAGFLGGINTTVKGGKAPYRYAWSVPEQSSSEINGLLSGTYTVTVTDFKNSSATATFVLGQPSVLNLTVDVKSPASTGLANGKAEAEISGGAGKYKYAWTTGETTALAEKLVPGENTVTVTDANGCTASATVKIAESVQPLAIAISQADKIACNGGSTALAVAVSGGKGPFKYVWSSVALRDDKPVASAGDYTLTVTDAKGTSSTAQYSVKQPQPLSASATALAPATLNADNGQAQATVTGGTPPYSYSWDGGERTAKAEKLGPGTHEATITDANGCATTAQVNIGENVQPLAASILLKSEPKCAGEKAVLQVQAAGGKPPLKYTWSNSSLSGETTEVGAGTYVVSISDAKGNVSTASATVKTIEPLTATAAVTQAATTNAANGQASATAMGGTTPYSYTWDNGEKAAKAEKLAPGSHTVSITDINGCATTATVSISENIQQLAVSLQVKKPLKCAGERASLQIQVNGGKSPFNYAWNNAALTGDRAEVESGDYAVTVTDAAGNSQTASASIKGAEAIEVTLTRNLGASSETAKDGKAAVSVKGGSPNYTITWDAKSIGTNVQNLGVGKHSVVVKDANGCTATLEFKTERIAMPELTKAIANGQTIRMRSLSFDTDSDKIKEESASMLDELYDFLSENPKVEIEVGGHTNNLPSDAFADKLSTNRAKAVADYLTNKGIDTKRVQYKGYGKRLPLEANTTEEGRKINQRVEIKILKS